MTDTLNTVKDFWSKLTAYSQKAQLDNFLSCYDESPSFIAISGDGQMRNYQEFKTVCTEYYHALKEQTALTTRENFNVIDPGLVVLSWTGNILARFKNGDSMKMDNYSITSVLRNFDNTWKIIHSHESTLPPEIIKNPI